MQQILFNKNILILSKNLCQKSSKLKEIAFNCIENYYNNSITSSEKEDTKRAIYIGNPSLPCNNYFKYWKAILQDVPT